jgi:hypothetical protein
MKSRVRVSSLWAWTAWLVACSLTTPLDDMTGGPAGTGGSVLDASDSESDVQEAADESPDNGTAGSDASDDEDAAIQPDAPDDGDAIVDDLVDALPDRSPLAGAIVEWLLDEGSGWTTRDSAGDCVLNLGATPQDPVWTNSSEQACEASALQFDGRDDLAIATPCAVLDKLTTFSVAFCIFPVTPIAGDTQFPRVLSMESLDPGYDQFFVDLSMEVIGASGLDPFRSLSVAVFSMDPEAGLAIGTVQTVADSVPMDSRSCWVITYDDGGDRYPHVYRDGQEVAYAGMKPLAGTYSTTKNPVVIGNRRAGDRPLHGVLDTIRIFDYVLPQDRIKQVTTNACSG